MSRTIENRIVQMEFQNKQFEDAVEQSRQSIQLLEKDLQLLEGVQALKNLDEAVQNIDVSGIAEGIEDLNKRFSTLGIISMTITQNLTNAFSNLLIGGLKNVGSTVTGLFNNIMTRGMNRAKNIENAKFSLMGLLKDADKVQQVFDIASASVDGTAYALDSAAKAASTLVATFGSDASGLASVDKALKGIVGVAAQTNREFDDVAQIFTTVAGNGRVMGMQLTQLSSYGLNAAAAIAEYLNQADNKKLRKKLNVGKWASESEVRELVSKGKITADMFSEAFYGFYENAEKANETVEGVKSNINAALGRIGQAFISPLIEQNSPLVKFLNTVRTLINGIKSSILDLKIPDYVTETLNMMIEYAQGVIGQIDPGEWSIFKNISVLTSNIRRSLEIVKETDSEGNEIVYDAQHKTNTMIETWNKYFNQHLDLLRNNKKKTLKTTEEYFKGLIVDRFGEEALKSYEHFGTKYLHAYGVTTQWIENAQREAQSMMAQGWADYRVAYNGSLVEQAQMYADEETDKYMETSYKWIEMWHTNYIQNIMDAISNISETFGFLKDTVNEAIIGIGGPFAEFWQMITGQEDNATSLRLVINGITNLIKEGTEKIKNYIQDNDDIKGIIEGIVSVFIFLGKVVSSVWTILGNAFKSFAPLFERIVRLLGAVGSTMYGITTSEDEMSVFTVIVEKLSGAIDLVARALIFLWDMFAEGARAFDFNEVWENQKDLMGNIRTAIEYVAANFPIWMAKLKPYLEKFIGAIIKIGMYIGTNFPIWFEKAKPYLKIFGDKIVEIGGFLTDVLGGAFDTISPYVDELVGWLGDLTGDFDGIKQPIEQVTTVLEDNAGALETVNNVAGTVSDTISEVTDVFGGLAITGAATGGGFGSIVKAFAFDAVGLDIDKIYEKKGKLTESVDQITEDSQRMLTPWERIKALFAATYEFVNGALINLGFLDEGQTIGEKLKEFFKGIGDWAKNVDWMKVLDTLLIVAQKIANVFLTLSGGKLLRNTGSFIKKDLPKMFGQMTTMVQSFSPFYRDMMMADNKTTRKEATAKILKSFALVIISIAAAVAVVSYAIYKLGSMDPDKLRQGIQAVGLIMTLIVGIIMFLGAILLMITGKGESKTTTETSGLPAIKGIKGIKEIFKMVRKGGLAKETKTVTSTGQDAWKSIAAIAGVIAAFGVAVALISLSIGYLATFGDTELQRGIGAFVQIAGVIIILMILLGAFAVFLRGGSNETIFGGSESGNKYAGKFKNVGTKVRKSERNNSDWKVIAALAVSILIISVAIGGLMAAIAVLANIPMNNLDNAMTVFWEVTAAIAGMVVIIGLIATLMTAFNKNKKKGIGGGIIAMAVLIGVIGLVIGGLMQIIVEIALLPIKDVTNAVTIFTAVVDAITMIIAVVGTIIVLISAATSFGKNGDKVTGALLSASLMFAAIGVMFVAIGASFLLIGMGIGAIAVAFKGISENELNSIVLIMGIIGTMVVLVMAAVAVMIGLAKKQDGQGLKELPKIILATATIFVGLGVMFAAIGLMAKLIGESGVDIGQLKNIIITITVLVSAVMICIAVMVGLSKDAMFLKSLTLVLVATAALFAGLAIMFFGIGEMAKLIGESGVSLDSLLGIIITITVLVTAVMVCVAVIVGLMETGVGEVVLGVILSVAALFSALGFLFISIGAMAILIGFGVELFVDALTKFINFFMSLDDGKMDSTMSNLEKFMYGLGTVVFAGLIGIATFLDANRERVVDAIKKIIKFIMEAIFASIEQTWDSSLDTLTHLIESLQVWLNKNKFEIISIIEDIGEILYTIIDTFMDNLVKLILGENYDGGEDGYLGQLTKGLIMWLRTYFLDEGAIGRTLFRDLFNVLGEEAHQGILDFLDLIINSQDIPLKTFEAIDAVICGIGNAIVTKGPEIVDHVKELIRVTWALIKYALGISDVPPQSTMFGITGGAEKGDPEGAMDEMADDMMSELSNVDWLAAVGDFLSALWNTMLDVAAGVHNVLPGAGGLLGLGKMIADMIVNGAQDGLQEKSPSKRMEQVGVYAVEGLYNGLRNRRINDNISSTSTGIAERIVNTVGAGLEAVGNPTNNFLSGFSDELTKLKTRLGYLVTPLFDTIEAKISPYLDLTQIEEGFGSIQDMMNGNSEFDISAINADSLSSMTEGMTDSSGATDAAEGFDDVNMPDMGLLSDVQPETILNFTQNNYSPESLARIDIYRDTKNLLNDPSNLRNLIGVGGISSLLNYHEGGSGSRF